MRTELLAEGAVCRGTTPGETQELSQRDLSAFRGIGVALTASLLMWGVGVAVFWALHH